MKTNSSKGKKSLNKVNIFFYKLNEKRINNIALFTGFLVRKTKKIKPLYLFIGFYRMTMKNLNTYEDWSSEISHLCGKTLSKQAVEDRMGCEATNMIRLVFQETLNSILLEKVQFQDKELIRKFNSIYADDSTTLNLPEELNEFFPGNVSRGKKKAQIKIHAMYNFSDNSFPYLSVHNYTESDQGLAWNILPLLKPNDLILRDLGFQNLSIQKELIEKGIYFVSKKKSGVKVFDSENHKEINLIRYLRKKRFFDAEVLVGAEDKVRMRLVIRPLSKEVAAERKRKAKKDRDQRLNHSKEYYELLGYSILLTNIPLEICDRKEISELYGLRWKIETIFKSWKSNFSLEKIIPERCNNPERINCIIYLMLILILLYHTCWLGNKDLKEKNTEGNAPLSLLKLTKFFKQHFGAIESGENNKTIIKQLKKQCKYETRNDRENTMEKYHKLSA